MNFLEHWSWTKSCTKFSMDFDRFFYVDEIIFSSKNPRKMKISSGTTNTAQKRYYNERIPKIRPLGHREPSRSRPAENGCCSDLVKNRGFDCFLKEFIREIIDVLM